MRSPEAHTAFHGPPFWYSAGDTVTHSINAPQSCESHKHQAAFNSSPSHPPPPPRRARLTSASFSANIFSAPFIVGW